MSSLFFIAIPDGTCVFLTIQLKMMYFGVCFQSRALFIFPFDIYISYLFVRKTRLFGTYSLFSILQTLFIIVLCVDK